MEYPPKMILKIAPGDVLRELAMLHWWDTWRNAPPNAAIIGTVQKNDQPVGVARLFFDIEVWPVEQPEDVYSVVGIGGVYVDPQYRGRGIATGILRAVRETFRSVCDGFILQSWPRPLYSSQGFRLMRTADRDDRAPENAPILAAPVTDRFHSLMSGEKQIMIRRKERF